MDKLKCHECGAPLNNVKECRDYLNEMIKWDFEDFTGVGQVHHLTVLCYNLQHPSNYSPKGLEEAKNSLKNFILNPNSFKEHDMSNRNNLASNMRDWKIIGTVESHGTYPLKPSWKILASDVVMGGLNNYVGNVKKWAQSVLESLEESDELT